ncbi:sigma-54-dependent transcriptional regulator [Oceanidesulfovibrio marinus]|uniref:Sigma-54-dependent Fis family transcriptional regulator n=1 Tax=Oceanidesulfovibrio marinus TaxID=370038 RepID=A0ABX6NGI5_9BACT|nr:sigma-54 dependent transcriptional regulator [Oceanidesulfovibrio marinus]QJT09724.1 sigma-54-dependent Fis family transcriptional regulator [Oceanidesulfovibrio marinus]
MARILVIDDDPGFGYSLCRIAEQDGHEGVVVQTLEKGRNAVREQDFDLVFLDVNLPDGSGLDALDDIRSAPSNPQVIIVTGFGDPNGAELAITHGAFNYIDKGSSFQQIVLNLQRALSYQEREKGLARHAMKLAGIVGESPAMQRVLEQVAQAAASKVPVLVSGETGTGKELMARAIHTNSARGDKPFVVVDCAALPENLVESILFGHVKGAFTGADAKREGLVALADGGTLFLDEIGELPLTVQKMFLRVLQERMFRPVGSRVELSSDFRLISATNRDLDAMCAGGEFREDLLFRIRAMQIELPPLRDRQGDISRLVRFHLERIGNDSGQPAKSSSSEFLQALTAHHWPGNVRELVNALEQANVAAGSAPMLYPEHLNVALRVGAAKDALQTPAEEPAAGATLAPDGPVASGPLPTFKEYRNNVVDKAEAEYMRAVLRQCGGNVPEACVISGLSRTRLYGLLKKHGLTPSAS